MPWEQKDKYYAHETETNYRVCATRNNGVIIYESCAPRKHETGYEHVGHFSTAAEAKEFCKTHFNNQQGKPWPAN